MGVPVSWVLAQTDLSLRLAGGGAGLAREISIALTTELADAFRWLSGGELVLTTGLGLPADHAAYLRGIDECGVAAVGFATGLTYDSIPADLVTTADEIGLPLFEVPLATPFAAVVQRVSDRLAEVQYDAVLRASRAQPRMTRAVINGGAAALVAELARALAAKVFVLDPAGAVAESHPRAVGPDLLDDVRAAVGVAGAGTVRTGISITHQRIKVGNASHGDLVVVTREPLTPIDQILLGHANSLLALDFEKPARLAEAQRVLNGSALGLLLSGQQDLAPARAQLAQVADANGRIRALVIDCETADSVVAVRAALVAAIDDAGHPLFVHAQDRQLVAVLPATENTHFARRLATVVPGATRKLLRVGLSGAHVVDRLAEAVGNARIAAAAAERGALPLEFTAFAGRALLSTAASRAVLEAVADTVLQPVADYDRANGTQLLESLRAFLEANGHWETAAAAIDVHRHTMRKRVMAAQDLLGLNLDIARVRAELLLAIYARK